MKIKYCYFSAKTAIFVASIYGLGLLLSILARALHGPFLLA